MMRYRDIEVFVSSSDRSALRSERNRTVASCHERTDELTSITYHLSNNFLFRLDRYFCDSSKQNLITHV